MQSLITVMFLGEALPMWGHPYCQTNCSLCCLLGMTNTEVLYRVQRGYRMPCPLGCPPALYDIMLDCWCEYRTQRPTFDELYWELRLLQRGMWNKKVSAY
jgi:hypothetical protein